MMSPAGDSLTMIPNWFSVSSPDSSTVNRSVKSIACSPSPLRSTYGWGLPGRTPFHCGPLAGSIRYSKLMGSPGSDRREWVEHPGPPSPDPSRVPINGSGIRDEGPWPGPRPRLHGAVVGLTRLRMDELVNAWVADRCTPFQIALIGVFDAAPFLLPDGTVDVPRIRGELAVRARRVPAFRRRVVWTRFGEGMPVWAADPSFDANRHIGSDTLPGGAELASWAADRIVRPLPMDRPLWRADVVDGLPQGRFALIVVVHHVAADGLTGVSLAGSLLDGIPDAVVPDAPVQGAPPQPTHADLLRDRLRGVAAALRRARPFSGTGFARLLTMVRQFRDASSDLRTRTSETSLPRRVGPTRRLAVVRAPLDELKLAG